jgi:hypothetical protein
MTGGNAHITGLAATSCKNLYRAACSLAAFATRHDNVTTWTIDSGTTRKIKSAASVASASRDLDAAASSTYGCCLTSSNDNLTTLAVWRYPANNRYSATWATCPTVEGNFTASSFGGTISGGNLNLAAEAWSHLSNCDLYIACAISRVASFYRNRSGRPGRWLSTLYCQVATTTESIAVRAMHINMTGNPLRCSATFQGQRAALRQPW